MTASAPFWPYLTILFSLVAWVLSTRLRFGSIVSPFSTVLLMLAAIYGVRPILMYEAGSFDFYGINIENGVDAASFVGFVGIVALIAGYGFATIARRRRQPGSLWATPSFAQSLSRKQPSASFIVALSFLFLWLLLMIVLGGGVGFLAVLFAGRSADAGAAFAGVPAVVLAIPVISALLIAAVRFRYERFAPYSLRQSVGYWIVGFLCIVPPSALGNRRFLIPSLIALIAGSLAARWSKRLTLKWVVLAAVGFLALAILPFVRSAGSRTGRTDLIGAMLDYFDAEGLSGVFESFFLSYDTEMFNYVAYLAPRLGESIPFGYGRGTVGELLLAPLPSNLLPFQTWSNELLRLTFGGSCGQVACPVPSVIGTLYYDLAFPGLVIGMLLIGMLCASFEGRLLRSDGWRVGLLLLLAGFAPVFARGNFISQLWIAGQCFVILAVLLWLLNKLHPGSDVQATGSRTSIANRTSDQRRQRRNES